MRIKLSKAIGTGMLMLCSVLAVPATAIAADTGVTQSVEKKPTKKAESHTVSEILKYIEKHSDS